MFVLGMSFRHTDIVKQASTLPGLLQLADQAIVWNTAPVDRAMRRNAKSLVREVIHNLTQKHSEAEAFKVAKRRMIRQCYVDEDEPDAFIECVILDTCN